MPFKKGEVTNPKGRPKGSKNKTTLLRDSFAFAGRSFDDEFFTLLDSMKKSNPEIVFKYMVEYGFTKPPQEQEFVISDGVTRSLSDYFDNKPNALDK